MPFHSLHSWTDQVHGPEVPFDKERDSFLVPGSNTSHTNQIGKDLKYLPEHQIGLDKVKPFQVGRDSLESGCV